MQKTRQIDWRYSKCLFDRILSKAFFAKYILELFKIYPTKNSYVIKFCEREKIKAFSIDQILYCTFEFPHNLNFQSSIFLRFLQSSQYAKKTKHNQFLIEKPLLFFQVGENQKKSSKIKVWMQWYETNHSLKQKVGQSDHCRHVPKAGLTTHFGLIWKVGSVN